MQGGCGCKYYLQGLRFFSCNTDSHLAPVPNIVMLEMRKGDTDVNSLEQNKE